MESCPANQHPRFAFVALATLSSISFDSHFTKANISRILMGAVTQQSNQGAGAVKQRTKFTPARLLASS